MKLPQPPKFRMQHVAVLMGGWSAEREISLKSGTAVADALEAQGYKVSRLDVNRDIAKQLTSQKPDVCFNALHGRFGEDGCVQGVLEALQLPYTHSGVLASALAMHKQRAKIIMKASGVPVAEAVVRKRSEVLTERSIALPFVIKPVDEGSSVGVFILRNEEKLSSIKQDLQKAGAPEDELMIEKYVPGRELTCAVIGDFITDVIEISPKEGLNFYDFEAKYAPGGSIHQLPAKILPNVYQLVRKYTGMAHQALGCKGVSRADFRYDDTSSGTVELVCLEVNTQPGMTKTSLVPELAQFAGWSFGDLVRWMIEDASCLR
ncbi:MAG: D-alanine--D-alanine ligase [Hyphomicrobium sp.]